MNIAHTDAPAVLGWKRVCVEESDSAVSRLLMAVVGDRTQLHRKGRVSARLPFVVARFNKMKEVIVRPVTGFDDCGAFGVPGDAIRIAGAFRENLELTSAGMDPPHGASEVVSLAILGEDVALVEHAVQPVKPAVRTPAQRTGQLVRIRATEPGEHHLATHFLAVLLAQEKQIWRIEHPDAAVPNGDAGGNVQSASKHRHFFGASVAIGVFQDLHAVASWPRGLARVFDALGDPNPPAIIEGHRDGIYDVRFAGDQLDAEAFWHRHPAQRLQWCIRLVRWLILAMRYDLIIFCGGERFARDQCKGECDQSILHGSIS